MHFRLSVPLSKYIKCKLLTMWATWYSRLIFICGLGTNLLHAQYRTLNASHSNVELAHFYYGVDFVALPEILKGVQRKI